MCLVRIWELNRDHEHAGSRSSFWRCSIEEATALTQPLLWEENRRLGRQTIDNALTNLARAAHNLVLLR